MVDLIVAIFGGLMRTAWPHSSPSGGNTNPDDGAQDN